MSEFPPNGVAFVTGAGSGIGKAVAHRFVTDGIRKIAIVDLSPSRLEESAASIQAIHPEVKVLKIPANCCKEGDVEAAIQSTVSEFGQLDFCCNAAGIAGNPNKIHDVSTPDLDAVLDLNLKGLWYCERAQIRQMMKQEYRELITGLSYKTRGAIVNIGSSVSLRGMGKHSPYVMAKHGVLGLTRTDGIDYGPEGIRINCICPGFIRTNIITPEEWESGPATQSVLQRTPMGRLGAPDEVAYLAIFLASDKASFITGTSVSVDGGINIR